MISRIWDSGAVFQYNEAALPADRNSTFIMGIPIHEESVFILIRSLNTFIIFLRGSGNEGHSRSAIVIPHIIMADPTHNWISETEWHGEHGMGDKYDLKIDGWRQSVTSDYFSFDIRDCHMISFEELKVFIGRWPYRLSYEPSHSDIWAVYISWPVLRGIEMVLHIYGHKVFSHWWRLLVWSKTI